MKARREFPKVAFVAGTLGRGGAERQLYYQVKALAAAGATPVVASLSTAEHWEQPIRELGVEVISFGDASSPAKRVTTLGSLLLRHRPHVVQSAHFYTNLYVTVVARLLGIRGLGAIRNDTRWSVDQLGLAGMASLRVPRHIAVNSLAALEQAVLLGVNGARLTYLPNVVDTGTFTPARRSTNGVHLLDVGRLVDQKRHDRFLRVVRSVVDALPAESVRATVVGEGPDLDSLLRQRATLGLDSVVTFINEASMERLYPDASMLVLTSDYEGTPNVVLEAMSAALPVVAFRIGGVAEIIPNDECGVTIAPGDERAMIEAVIGLSTDPARRASIGDRAREHVERTRSPAALLGHLRTLYRRTAVQMRIRNWTP